MTEYQVLARRWRPQRFEELVGQEVVVRTLRNAVADGQVAHAYLFSGLRGVGKTTVARLLAKALNCEKGPTPEPCGECAACREIAAGSAMDVLEMDAASNRGIDEVRQLREMARVLPVRDRYRVFILDEAHQLSRDAFNALLKILEEPPAHVVFILASTEKHKFPSTILSRCLQVDFRPIPTEVIVQRLLDVAAGEPFDLAPGAAELIARAAEGSLRDALSLLDRVRAFASEGVDEDAVAEVLGLPPMARLLDLFDALAAADVAAALALVRDEEAAGHDPVALYEQLVHLLNTLLLLACDASAPMPFPEAQRDGLVERAERMGTALLVRAAQLALEQRGLIAVADQAGVAVAVAVARLAQWPRLVRVEELLAGTFGAPSGGPGEPPAAPSKGSPPRSAPPKSRPTGGGAAAGGETTESETTASPAPTDPRQRLADVLDRRGAHLLAGRVRRAEAAEIDGSTLRLRFNGTPPATVRSLREAGAELSAAALEAGLPQDVEVAGGDEAAREGLRERVEADETVQRVMDIFGGRIERVEEGS